VATLFDGRQLHYQAASDELLSRLPATQRRREA
jgi:hypothetical protein